MTNEELLKAAIKTALTDCGIEATDNDIVIERTKDEAHGDYATNVAMRLSKKAGKRPLDFANDLIAKICSDNIEKIEIAGPGFINFFMKQDSLKPIVKKIFEEKENFGRSERKNLKVNVEFVSANPTGLLHVGTARGAAYGDSLSRILDFAVCLSL